MIRNVCIYYSLHLVIFTTYIVVVNIYINVTEVSVILVGFVIRGKIAFEDTVSI